MTTRVCFTPNVSSRPPQRSIAARWLAMIVLAGVFSSGCDSSPVTRQADHYPSQIEALAARGGKLDPLAESQRRGRDVYLHYCQICHGADAQGNGFNAAMLDPPPRNFTEAGFWNQASNETLVAVISDGGPAADKSVLMPAWGNTLSQQQVRDAIAYLRAAPKRAEQAEISDEVDDSEAN